MRRKQTRRKEREEIDFDCCATCKRFSSEGYRLTGFCMKQRKSSRWDSYCGYYTPDVKVQYEQECKRPNSW